MAQELSALPSHACHSCLAVVINRSGLSSFAIVVVIRSHLFSFLSLLVSHDHLERTTPLKLFNTKWKTNYFCILGLLSHPLASFWFYCFSFASLGFLGYFALWAPFNFPWLLFAFLGFLCFPMASCCFCVRRLASCGFIGRPLVSCRLPSASSGLLWLPLVAPFRFHNDKNIAHHHPFGVIRNHCISCVVIANSWTSFLYIPCRLQLFRLLLITLVHLRPFDSLVVMCSVSVLSVIMRDHSEALLVIHSYSMSMMVTCASSSLLVIHGHSDFFPRIWSSIAVVRNYSELL